MVQLVLALLLLAPTPSRAQFLGFGGEDNGFKSRIPELTEKLRSQEIKLGPQYEEAFNLAVKGIENAVEEEKLYCAGEAVDAAGKMIPADKKQLCIRELKKNYLEAMGTVFEQKKKYLELIHNRQLERLNEVHAKLKTGIEKNF